MAPLFGEDSGFESYFSDGLKPASRCPHSFYLAAIFGSEIRFEAPTSELASRANVGVTPWLVPLRDALTKRDHLNLVVSVVNDAM